MSPHLALAMALTVASPPAERLAAMPLAAKNLSPETVQILDLLLVAELEATGSFAVVRPADIDAMLGLERLKDAAGCDDVSCATDLAQALGVGLLMTGTVGKLGDELVVQLTLIDAREQQVKRRGQVTAAADERAYRDAIKRAVAEVLGLAAPSTPPARGELSGMTLRFDTTDPTRTFGVKVVTSDGVEHGCVPAVTSTSACTIHDIARGRARLAMTSPPLSPYATDLTAKSDKETVVYSLRRSPGLASLTAWTYGGVAVAAGIALIAVGAATDHKGMIYGGVPAAVVGGGLIGLGFTFDGMVVTHAQHLREDGKRESWLPFF